MEMVSRPGVPKVPPPTLKPAPPMFQVEPGPVTVAVGVPKEESISAPPWLLSTPPLLMETVPGPKMPMPVKPFTVTLEPAPLMIMLLATRRSLAAGVSPTCSVAPLMTERVPRHALGEPVDGQGAAVNGERSRRAKAEVEIAPDHAA